MRLKNKKTGEIKNVNHNKVLIHFNDGQTECINSLAELNEEWEDYKEPKEYWHIFGTNITKTQEGLDEIYDKRNKEIGNYFSTREETELAVRKLKAWKRLKDKGLKNTAWDWSKVNNSYRDDDGKIYIKVILKTETYDRSWDDDLDLLFGGEE